nr:hypothetical protein [uncultured Rhodoferax sp.]
MMSWFKSARVPSAAVAEGIRTVEQLQHSPPLSANAQMWRRLARDGYDRTAEQVRASQPAPLQREIDSPSQR